MDIYIIEEEELKVRFIEPDWEHTKVNISYFDRDRLLSCDEKDVQSIVREILELNR